MSNRQPIRLVAALLVALTLAAGATAANRPAVTPVHVVLSHTGPRLSGPTVWKAGTVEISATSQLPDQEVNLLHFRAGYTYADFLADGKKARGHSAAARAAIARVLANTVFDGGLNLFGGQSATFAVSVAPGTYYLGEMTSRPQLTAIHVSGRPSASPLHSSGTITATGDGYRITGAPLANGWMTIANAGSREHRINLIPVKPRTTRAQLMTFIRTHGVGENAPPPPFALNGPEIGTADLSPGQRIQVTFHLPAGTYAAIDFDQDMRNGRPDSVEGFATVLTLR